MNPFVLGYIRPEEELCDREIETEDLCRHAKNATHVVMISPRRLGKTSLVWRVLDDLAGQDFIPIYVDLLSVTSKENFVNKLVSAVTKGIGKSLPTESFLQTIRNLFTRIIPSVDFRPEGISVSAKFDTSVTTHALISDVLDGLEEHAKRQEKRCLLVFDEFQEITELPESKEIEGLLREKLQASRVISCFFVGSRRRVLEEMFTDQRRPFYKMTMLFKLGKIQRESLAHYVSDRFSLTGKDCPLPLAGRIYDDVDGHTYYVQKLSHIVWDKTTGSVTEETVAESFRQLLEAESGDFHGIWTNLGWTEKRVLMAIALEPTAQPYASAFLSRYSLSIGSMQKGLKQLIVKDIVEVTETKTYQPTDPILMRWCRVVSSSGDLRP